jgi:hypothetical protein
LCYAGHLGNWVDNWVMARYKITEVVHEDKTYTLQLKGAGPTPYSRTAMVLRYCPPLENIYVPKPCIIWEFLRHVRCR